MRNLFGTDGIRGVANEYPITSEMAVKIGRAIAFLFKNNKQGKSKIVIGRDTRISGHMIESALISGICSMGVDVHLAGVFPTPGVAFLTSFSSAAAGIVISASHNPYYDNGLKIFNKHGYKLNDEKEKKIEQLVFDDSIHSISKTIHDTGQVFFIDQPEHHYIQFLKQAFSENFLLNNFKIIIDCSNGATYKVAPLIFLQLKGHMDPLFISPDGKNINENCGSQHTETLSSKVIKDKADIGLAFDGDGDRLIAVDEKGNEIKGDQILAICSKFAKEKGKLDNALIVSTVMSNIGLSEAFKNMDIKHIKANVGDRYVLEKMISHKSVMGGEDSGHMIFLDHHTTGDGIFTALKLLEVMKETSKPLGELAKIMGVYPQILMNVEVKSKPDINEIPEIMNIIKSTEADLGEKGRVLVRYSGTQPLCRIMVEGPSIKTTKKYCTKITNVVKNRLGLN